MNTEEFLKFSGKIIITTSFSHNYSDVIKFLTAQPILGFDTETRPSFKKGVSYLPSLIQLATSSVVVLYRIHQKRLPVEIIQLFENKNIIKVGAGISQDLKNLQKLSVFTPQSFVDIQKIARDKGLENVSLRELCEQLLFKKLSKRQQLSNWENAQLTVAQIQYAATDAYACLLIYEVLCHESASNTTKEK